MLQKTFCVFSWRKIFKIKDSGRGMENNRLEVIIVPSGNYIADKIRLNRAREYAEEIGEEKEIRYVLSGIGPDLNRRLHLDIWKSGRTTCAENSDGKQEKFYDANYMDVHEELWNGGIDIVNERQRKEREHLPFGVDTGALDSIENMVNVFYKIERGNYSIVSRTLHNVRFKLIEKELRKKDYIPESVEIKYVNTQEKFNLKDFVRDILSLVKYFVRGKYKLRYLVKHPCDYLKA